MMPIWAAGTSSWLLSRRWMCASPGRVGRALVIAPDWIIRCGYRVRRYVLKSRKWSPVSDLGDGDPEQLLCPLNVFD